MPNLKGKIKNMFGSQDMTVGNPMKNLLQFSVPLLIGNFVQQLYATVDSIVVGNYIGDEALAAIGLTGPIINLLLVLFVAIATGGGIMVSQYYGARQKDELSKAVGTACTIIAVVTAAISVLGMVFTGPLLNLINTPQDAYQLAYDYLFVIMLGQLGCAFYNLLSGALRAMGDSLYPFIFLVVASLINIVLDIWFVAGLNMGTAGAAWATIIAQAISAILCFIRLLQMKEDVTVNLNTLKPRKSYAKKLLSLGLPGGIQQAIFSLSTVLVQSLTNSMGTAVVACSTAIMRVDGFAMMPNFSFGMAIATYVGQNMGAKKLDRVEEGTKACLKLSVSVALVLVAAIVLFGKQMIALFTTTPQIIDMGGRMMKIMAVGYIAMSFMQLYGGVMRGAGDTMPSMWISLIGMLCLRLPTAYLFAYLTRTPEWPNGTCDALYYSLLLDWLVGATVTYLWYRRGNWKNKAIVK